MINSYKVDRLKLQSAKLQSDASKCALQLLGCLFSAEELVNGNPSGTTTAKDEIRRQTIKKLDPVRMKYIMGMFRTFNHVLYTLDMHCDLALKLVETYVARLKCMHAQDGIV